MPKELENITDSVMDKIHQGRVKMRPKLYFVAGSILVFAGLAMSIVSSVFLVGLSKFFFRSRGFAGQYRLDFLLSNFPWWLPILAFAGLAVGIWLLRKYDFSYKRNFLLVAIGFVAAILVAGWIIDSLGLNEALLKRGPMRGMMRQYLEDGGTPPHSGPGWYKNNIQLPR